LDRIGRKFTAAGAVYPGFFNFILLRSLRK
jgi:hypothetical protein